MRIAAVFVVVVGLFACGEAQFDTSALTELGKNLVGTLLGAAKDTVTDLANQGLAALLGKIGKRDLDLDAFKKHIAELKAKFPFDGYKKKATDAFKAAMDKLKALYHKFHTNLGHLKDAKAHKDAVDDAVAEHHVTQKRLLEDLIQKGKDLFGAAVQRIKDGLAGLKAGASSLVSGLLQKATNLAVGKRQLENFRSFDVTSKRATLSDHLQTIGNAISSAVSPFKDIVAGLGTTLKGHFSNLVDAVKGHVTALKGKLQGHIDDIKTHGQALLNHGKNALGALSEVVSDILKQTLANAKPSIDGLSKTVADAGQTVLNHFTGGKTN